MTQDQPEPSLEQAKESGERNPWLTIGIFGALGFEFVGFMIVGALVGTWIDRRWDTQPFGLIVTMLLMMLAVGWHIVMITRRLHRNGDPS